MYKLNSRMKSALYDMQWCSYKSASLIFNDILIHYSVIIKISINIIGFNTDEIIPIKTSETLAIWYNNEMLWCLPLKKK